uniref:protein YgfX n=1 Tax=Thaumasiovibrio occultus TaxID=1891184 RepID=UPI000B359194|nr:protein YgfX [Thaumasiovibrio occultus]
MSAGSVLLLISPLPLEVAAFFIVWLQRWAQPILAEISHVSGRLQLSRAGKIQWQSQSGRWCEKRTVVLSRMIMLAWLPEGGDWRWLWIFPYNCRDEDYRHLQLLVRYPDRASNKDALG